MTEKGIPLKIIHQLMIFLMPLLVRTAGDVTETVAVLIKWLIQGGIASPALFRFSIDDLSGDLREGKGKPRTATWESLDDACKMDSDDVILVADTKEEMYTLLGVCTRWAQRNSLQWKPTKGTIVVQNPEECHQ